jgi:hypothetical protein
MRSAQGDAAFALVDRLMALPGFTVRMDPYMPTR